MDRPKFWGEALQALLACKSFHPSQFSTVSFRFFVGFESLYIMSFARTLFRTSRALRPHATNPLQSALPSRAQAQLTATAAVAFRGYATAFERNKPHVNIGTIGHVDHGKVRFRLNSVPMTVRT